MAKKKNGNRETVRKVKKAAKVAKKHKTLVAVLLTVVVIVLIAAIVLYAIKPPFLQPFLIKIGLMQDSSADNGNGGDDGNISGGGDGNVSDGDGNGSGGDDGDDGDEGDDGDVSGGDDGNGDGGGAIVGDNAEISSAQLSVHFLELGNKYTGDCTLIKCGDTEVLIDAGSKRDSAPVISKYIAEYCTDNVLEYVIATHAHEDHIAGFAGSATAKDGIIYEYSQNGKSIGTIIEFARHNTTSKIYSDYCDAVDVARQNGTKVYNAAQCYNQTDGASRQYFLDENEKVSINILYNYYYFNNASGENNYSVVTLLTEKTDDGKRNYLFTGDMEEGGERRMVDYYSGDMPLEYVTEYNVLPEVDLYKAGHHGSNTSSTEKLLSVIKPKNVAICCCAGSPEYTLNNNNTFPTQQTVDTISKYTQNVYVTSLATDVPEAVDGTIPSKIWGYTSMNGDIVFYVSESRLKLWCSNNLTVLKDTEWFIKNRVWG